MLNLNLFYLQHENSTLPDKGSYSKLDLLSPLCKPQNFVMGISVHPVYSRGAHLLVQVSTVSIPSTIYYYHCRNNPLRVLAFLEILFQLSLLLALGVHIHTTIIPASSVKLSSHLTLGLPCNLFPPGLDSKTLFAGLSLLLLFLLASILRILIYNSKYRAIR